MLQDLRGIGLGFRGFTDDSFALRKQAIILTVMATFSSVFTAILG